MFSWNGNIWTIIHFTAMAGLALYGMHRIWLLICWYKERMSNSQKISPTSFFPLKDFPTVTVQLPLFNERFVAARLIDAVAKFDWPKDKIEIQILDDSTDYTRMISDKRVDYWHTKGINIKVVRRDHREGFKSGALSHGLSQAKGEFIAIFDADFLPPPDFLVRTIPYFSDTRIGMVQTRWGFFNKEHSWLTGIQSILLGQHFSIEHWVRFKRGLFFNFNGTAGVWRRKAIESVGGWQSDTVTEDLDLSYRAELAGWRFIYLDDFVVLSELPVTLASFRSQQQRWAKGSIQTAKKILPRLIASNLPIAVKFEATAHLLSNFCWLLGAVVTVTLYSTIAWRVSIGPYQMLRLDLPLFIGTSFLIFFYFFIYAIQEKKKSFPLLVLLPVFTIGIAPSIALSVVKGFLSRGGRFERTPKFGLQGKERLPYLAFLYRQRSIPYLIMNTFFFIYAVLPIIFAWQRETWLAIPFLAVFPLGFLLVILKDLEELENWKFRKPVTED